MIPHWELSLVQIQIYLIESLNLIATKISARISASNTGAYIDNQLNQLI